MKIFSRTPDDFAKALHWPDQYAEIIKKKKYRSFLMAKKNGGQRKIETPGKQLKFLQKTVANTLQLLYSQHIPGCVHGYVSQINPTVGPRNILTNARAHQFSDYLLNLDIEKFFPTVDSIRIMELWRSWFPEMPAATQEMLTLLCTHKNYLPMGAPSSAVLSNMCMTDLDRQLMHFCKEKNIIYTRYVDDMSFSSDDATLADMDAPIQELVNKYGFNINLSKRKYYTKSDAKHITGLILHEEEITVEKELLKNMRRCIKEYERMKWLQRQMQMDKKWLQYKIKHMEQSISGQLAFLLQIHGSENATYQEFQQLFKKAKKRLPPSFNFYF